MVLLGIVILGLVGFALDRLASWLEYRIVPWGRP